MKTFACLRKQAVLFLSLTGINTIIRADHPVKTAAVTVCVLMVFDLLPRVYRRFRRNKEAEALG